jgi:hypothetical protein
MYKQYYVVSGITKQMNALQRYETSLGKINRMLNSAPQHEDVWGSGGIPLYIINIGTM